jgi:peptide/nickel transport system ATP-binding protein
MTGKVLLEARDIVRHFPLRRTLLGRGQAGVVHAVNGVSLAVRSGETLGIVGESGCGKSTLARCLTKLTSLTSGQLAFAGRDITRLTRRRMRPIRAELQMVFQDPYSSLNPRHRVGEILAEPLLVHHYGGRSAIRARVTELLELVGLVAADAQRYPREFSGGQRQRIGIARALALAPRLIVADEPVSALDVSIQAQVLNLFADLQHELGLTYIFIAHDLGVVRHVADRIAVMYLGTVVELSDNESLYTAPAHPYTEALLSAIPQIDDGRAETGRARIVLAGDVPNAVDLPSGCLFHSRCGYAQEKCRHERPALTRLSPGREVACHFPLAAGTPISTDLTKTAR